MTKLLLVLFIYGALALKSEMQVAVRPPPVRKALVGIVGCVGPAATNYLQDLVLEKDKKRCLGIMQGQPAFVKDSCHTPLIAYKNCNIPNNNLAALGKGPASWPELTRSVEALKSAGATHWCLACTTAYNWAGGVVLATGLPQLDLFRLVAVRAKQNHVKKIGLMDVDGTHAGGVFRKTLEDFKIEVFVPSEEDQLANMQAVGAVKSGEDIDTQADIMEKIVQNMIKKHEVDAIALGCTEMATALGPRAERFPTTLIIDGMDVLADAMIQITAEGSIPGDTWPIG
jgi:aspartate racemase